jgi:hypothetical protein
MHHQYYYLAVSCIDRQWSWMSLELCVQSWLMVDLTALMHILCDIKSRESNTGGCVERR